MNVFDPMTTSLGRRITGTLPILITLLGTGVDAGTSGTIPPGSMIRDGSTTTGCPLTFRTVGALPAGISFEFTKMPFDPMEIGTPPTVVAVGTKSDPAGIAFAGAAGKLPKDPPGP